VEEKYRPEIDGLRAVAVAPVVLYHAGFAGFGAGFLGVDVFFVISGYLITRIVHEEIRRGGFSILRFYERRARRILPALYLIVALCLIFGALWLLPNELRDLGRSAVAVALFGSNIYFNEAIGYFTQDVDLWPLIHTWSLAVEEQFYAVFPLLLLLAVPAGRKWTLAVVATLSVASMAWAQASARLDPQADFYLAQFRAWELGAGALIALAAPERLPLAFGMRWSLAGIGAALLALSFAFAPGNLTPSLASLAPVGGAALLVAFARPENIWGRALAIRPLVGIGLVSYSAYLWHQPVFAFLRYRFAVVSGGWAMALASLASFALAYLTWRFVERPFRDKARVSRGFVFGAAAACGVAFIVAGRIIAISHGMPGRVPGYVDASRIVGAYRNACLDLEASPPSALASVSQCRLGRRDSAPDFLLFGDSHAASLADGIDLAAKRAGRSGILLSANGCLPLLGVESYSPRSLAACRWQHDYLLDIVKALGVKLVIMHARWESLDESVVALADSHSPATEAELRAHMMATLSALSAAGAKAVIVTGTPSSRYLVPDILLRKALYGLSVDERPDFRRFLFDNRTASRLFLDPELRQMASVIDLYPAFCDSTSGGRCRMGEASHPYFIDKDHLSKQGALMLAPRLEDAFR
jgi:peptidoglycan/LPS O-acetylase OafA/YrhL